MEENNVEQSNILEENKLIEENKDEALLPISKKSIKRQRKLEQWESKKKEKRLQERMKYKRRRLEAIKNGLPINVGPSRKALKKNTSSNSKNTLRVIIDFDFDDFMIDREIVKSVKQLLRIYTINRRSHMPAKLIITGIKEEGKVHKILAKNNGYLNWDVAWYFKPYTDVFKKNEVIYLTSDSNNILNDLMENTIYIIGGLVDHNHHKGLCHDRANNLGIKTARLPLMEYVDMKTRSVLSTFHVFDILLRVSEGKPWSQAILEVLPKRKGAKPVESLPDS